MTQPLAPGTPLPWQYRDDYTSEGFVTIIGNVDGEYVDGQAHCTYDVVCRCEDEFGERLPNVGQNVRYLVHACNAYPDLLAMVEKLAGMLESLNRFEGHMAWCGHGNDMSKPCVCGLIEAQDAARATLTEYHAMKGDGK